MNNSMNNNIKPLREAIRISFIYIVVSVLWILATDIIILSIIGDNVLQYEYIKKVIGRVFVVLTSIMIFILVYHSVNKIKKLDKKLEDKISEISFKTEILNIYRDNLKNQQLLIDRVHTHSSMIIMMLDIDCKIKMINPFFMMLTGFVEEDIIGRKIYDFISDSKNKAYCDSKDGVKAGKAITNMEVILDCKGGVEKNILISITPSKDKNNEIYEFIAVGLDITENKHLEKTIQYLGSFDSITGLPNRSNFESKFNIMMEEKRHRSLAFLYIDIDNFRLINDTLGHDAGDSLLLNLGSRIQDEIKIGENILARITADEFGIILSDVEDKTALTMKVEAIQKVIEMPWQYGGEEFLISSTIGISRMPEDGLDFGTLLKKSNIAMQHGKISDKTEYYYYDEIAQKNVLNNVAMLSDIRKALTNKQFTLNYQFIKDLKQDKIYAAETLIRWQHPTKGNIPPVDFIPIAEKTNLIFDIENYAIDEALRQKKEWNEMGLKIPKIGINISCKYFCNEHFADFIEVKMKEYGIKRNELTLELTESGFMETTEHLNNNLNRLKEMGVRISLDDFGTGYSSLSRLKDLTIDSIKIDKSFIDNIHLNKEDEAMVASVIYLAETLGLIVVAEGIEKAEQIEKLKELGCTLGQGFYIYRPMSAEKIKKLLS